MLVISTSVGMLYGIFSYSTNLGPVITLDSILVVCVSSLEKRLVGTSTSSNNTDLSTDPRRNSFLSSGGKTKAGGALLIIMRNNNSKCSGSTSKSTAVTNLCLDVANNGSLGNRSERKNISNG
jgi:hypothetical protein